MQSLKAIGKFMPNFVLQAHEVTRLIKHYELIQEMKSEKEIFDVNYPAVMIKI